MQNASLLFDRSLSWCIVAAMLGTSWLYSEMPASGKPVTLRVEEMIAVGNVGPASLAEGIRFTCPPRQLPRLEAEMAAYLATLDIAPGLVRKQVDQAAGWVLYTLNTPGDDTVTLDLKERPELNIREVTLMLPAGHGKKSFVRTVSQKEIMLALLQHGRLTEFVSADCDIAALKDHIGIRQNTVAWVQSVSWAWPDGEAASWNRKYWRDGSLRPNVRLPEAINDIFINPEHYSVGCYTATKIVMVQGVVDYYRRVRKDPARLHLVESRLVRDREPLVAVEPGKMWAFEADYRVDASNHPGKLLKITYGVAAKNFVPGDWAYFLNTDPRSSRKTGYEGSTTVYLGGNKFSDYYNDNNRAYTYDQKLDQVYQWRNGVFSRQRDAARITPLTVQDFERLGRRPSDGGLLTDLRAFPYAFGHEELPTLLAAAPQ